MSAVFRILRSITRYYFILLWVVRRWFINKMQWNECIGCGVSKGSGGRIK